MAYKKPEIVAKSAAKETFVAGCPAKTKPACGGYSQTRNCELSQVK